MYRQAYDQLKEWKINPDRKPLIIEGVRQCGKTFLMKKFGSDHYKKVVYLNFEVNTEFANIFEIDIDPHHIVSKLSILFGERIEPETTLIIFDEIQFCNRALTSLKYFCEDAPEYHVMCAGSLLGILMSKPYSFPVGKVDRIRMFPMSFREFLLASSEELLVEEMDRLTPTDLFILSFRSKLESYLNTYLTIGGMPAAVSTWLETNNIKKVDEVLNGIMRDYEFDFSKHSTESVDKMTSVWKSIPLQLARENKKFFFGHVKSGARARDLEDAIEWLIDAGLIYKINLVDPPDAPLSFFADASNFKIYPVDVGLLRIMSKIDPSLMYSDSHTSDYYKGAITENYVLTELISAYGYLPFYWRSQGHAEVDFVIQDENRVIPIEVKSGHKVKSKSLSVFIERFDPPVAVIVSLDQRNGEIVKSIPLYWLWRIRSIIPEIKKPE